MNKLEFGYNCKDIVTGIEGVTQGHIHSAAEGENGPIVVTLFNFESPQSAVL